MRKGHFITLLICWLVAVDAYTLFAHLPVDLEGSKGGFADKAYYLVDSLKLAALSQGDRKLLDSALASYHKAKHDTGRVSALASLCNFLMDESWHKYQFIQYEMLINLIENDPASVLEKKYKILLADAVNNIGYIYHSIGALQKGLEYYNKSLSIYEEIEEINGVSVSFHNISLIYHSQGHIAKGLEYELQSLNSYREMSELTDENIMNLGKKGVAAALNNIGVVYMNQGDIEKGLEYYHLSLKIEEELGNKKGIAASLNNIGHIYLNQDDTEKGLEYFNMSLKIKEEIGNRLDAAISLNNIGAVYERLGELEKGLGYYQRGLKIRENLGDKEGVAISLNNIGLIYKRQGNIEKALESYRRSLKIFEEIVDKEGATICFYNIGNIYLDLNDIKKAKAYAVKSLEMAKSLGFPDKIKHAAILLSSINKKKGNFKQALEMYELYIQMRDSIKNEDTEKAVIRQQVKYEFEKAQLIAEQAQKDELRIKNYELNRRDNLQYSVILIVILVLFGGVLSLGFINVSERMTEGIVFFSFLILFEFFLVLADPYIDSWSGGAPGIKLLFNAGIAALIFPLHAFFEEHLKGKLVK